MALERWNPIKELEGMRREMDRIWDEIFPARRANIDTSWKKRQGAGVATPSIDIMDRDSEVIVRAEMPGVKKEDVEISLQENVLTLKGEVKDDPAVKEENYTYSERNYRFYARTVEIPVKIAQDRIKATLKDGVLTVTLPKAQDVQPKRINVEVA